MLPGFGAMISTRRVCFRRQFGGEVRGLLFPGRNYVRYVVSLSVASHTISLGVEHVKWLFSGAQ